LPRLEWELALAELFVVAWVALVALVVAMVVV
jgi:hypothetical protein